MISSTCFHTDGTVRTDWVAENPEEQRALMEHRVDLGTGEIYRPFHNFGVIVRNRHPTHEELFSPDFGWITGEYHNDNLLPKTAPPDNFLATLQRLADMEI